MERTHTAQGRSGSVCHCPRGGCSLGVGHITDHLVTTVKTGVEDEDGEEEDVSVPSLLILNSHVNVAMQ